MLTITIHQNHDFSCPLVDSSNLGGFLCRCDPLTQILSIQTFNINTKKSAYI